MNASVTVSTVTICPICGLENIALDKDRCPQCDADLTCFRVLDSLPEQPSEAQQRPGNRLSLFAFGGLLVLLLGTLFFFVHYRFTEIKGQMEDQNSVLNASLKNIDSTLARLAAERPSPGAATSPPPAETQTVSGERPPAGVEIPAADEIPSSPAPEKTSKDGAKQASQSNRTVAAAIPGPEIPATKAAAKGPKKPPLQKADFWLYRSDGRDTMWSLAERHYGAGRLYPVLLEHNPQVGLFHLKPGSTIRILKEPGAAKDIYSRIVKKEGNRLYWYYTVSRGDTLASIAARFLPKGERLQRMPRPGQKMRIPLE